MSTSVRQWLLERAIAGKKGIRVLHQDVADETGRLALKALRNKPKVKPAVACELLLLALTRIDPSEYAAALDEAGGP